MSSFQHIKHTKRQKTVLGGWTSIRMRVCKNVVVIRPGVFDKYNECVKSSNVKVHRMQEQMNNVRIYNFKEKVKGNANNQKHHNKNE